MNDAAREHETPLLAVTGLHVTYAGGEQAVRGMRFAIAPGETLAVVGRSGAGKTATALAIMGLLPATAEVQGSVRFRGRELLGLPAKDLVPVRGKDLAMVFQDSTLTPVHRVGDQIAEAVRAHTAISRRAAAGRAIELLADLDIPDAARVARAFPHQLSGGQRRRVMAAIAVAADPAVILADEPAAALDTVAQTHVLNTLQTARNRTGAALLLIIHDLAVAENRADRVLVVHAGQPVELGPTPEILHRPRSRHTTALLADAPLDRAVLPPAHPSPAPDPGPHLRGDPPAAESSQRPPESRTSAAPGPGTLRHAAPADPPVLEIRGLTRHYPPVEGRFPWRSAPAVRAVDGIDLDVRAAETLGLVGASGCGKTTTLREIVRLGVPQAGRVTVFGRDTATLPGRERRALRCDVQFLFQDPLAALDPRMTVGRSLTEPLGGRAGPTRVADLLLLVGLEPAYATRFPGELSGGQRQRVCLARALACEPKLLLLDEPFSALDVSAQAGIVTLLHDLGTRRGLSYLIAAHDLTAVRRLADRVAVMRLGRIVEIGDADTVCDTPAHPYTRTLLSTTPSDEIPGTTEPRTGCRFRTSCPVYAALTTPDRGRCTHEEPSLRHVRPGQAAACHFPAHERTSR